MKTYVVKIDPKRPDKKKIASAAKAVREGKLVAFPTETVYGVAANFLDEDAVDRLYSIKGRLKNKPFTVQIADIGMIESLGCQMRGQALRLAGKYWPGPLTMVLNAPGKKTLGFRIPANKIALELVRACGVPVAVPSANLSGNKAPTSAAEVLKDLNWQLGSQRQLSKAWLDQVAAI